MKPDSVSKTSHRPNDEYSDQGVVINMIAANSGTLKFCVGHQIPVSFDASPQSQYRAIRMSDDLSQPVHPDKMRRPVSTSASVYQKAAAENVIDRMVFATVTSVRFDQQPERDSCPPEGRESGVVEGAGIPETRAVAADLPGDPGFGLESYRMFIVRSVKKSWLRRSIDVSTPTGSFEIAYNGHGFGYESVFVNGELAARKASTLWYVPAFEFDIGEYRATIKVSVSWTLTIRRFVLEIDGQEVHAE